ncbi:MAG: aminoacyl-tRNA deacylase [Thermodesulfobacteriota bacterium]
MAKTTEPVTQAIRVLKAAGLAYRLHAYPYVDRGGAAHAASCLGISPHAVVKTLVMETDTGKPLLVLMHGDLEVSTKSLARHLGVKSVFPCSSERANRLTGYVVGGISPFGVRTPMPVYMEASILLLNRMLINAGKRGWLVELHPGEAADLLHAEPVEVGISA